MVDVLLNLIEKKIINPFGVPSIVLSDNVRCIKMKSLKNFIMSRGIKWWPVWDYALMYNGRAERMVGTIKRAVDRTVASEKVQW